MSVIGLAILVVPALHGPAQRAGRPRRLDAADLAGRGAGRAPAAVRDVPRPRAAGRHAAARDARRSSASAPRRARGALVAALVLLIVPGTALPRRRAAQGGQRRPPAVLPHRRGARRAALPRPLAGPRRRAGAGLHGLLVPAWTERETWVGAGLVDAGLRRARAAGRAAVLGRAGARRRRRRSCARSGARFLLPTVTGAPTSARCVARVTARERRFGCATVWEVRGEARLPAGRRARRADGARVLLRRLLRRAAAVGRARAWRAAGRGGARVAAAAPAAAVGRAALASGRARRLDAAVGRLGAARRRRARRRSSASRSTSARCSRGGAAARRARRRGGRAGARRSARCVVVGYGLSGRLLPGLVHLAASQTALGRLEQPLTYWNAMGALAAIGLVLARAWRGDRARRAALRAAAARRRRAARAGRLPVVLARRAGRAGGRARGAAASLAPDAGQLRAVGARARRRRLRGGAGRRWLPGGVRALGRRPRATREGAAMLVLLARADGRGGWRLRSRGAAARPRARARGAAPPPRRRWPSPARVVLVLVGARWARRGRRAAPGARRRPARRPRAWLGRAPTATATGGSRSTAFARPPARGRRRRAASGSSGCASARSPTPAAGRALALHRDAGRARARRRSPLLAAPASPAWSWRARRPARARAGGRRDRRAVGVGGPRRASTGTGRCRR